MYYSIIHNLPFKITVRRYSLVLLICPNIINILIRAYKKINERKIENMIGSIDWKNECHVTIFMNQNEHVFLLMRSTL